MGRSNFFDQLPSRYNIVSPLTLYFLSKLGRFVVACQFVLIRLLDYQSFEKVSIARFDQVACHHISVSSVVISNLRLPPQTMNKR